MQASGSHTLVRVLVVFAAPPGGKNNWKCMQISIPPFFTHIQYPLQCHMAAGAYPSAHWTRGRTRPHQVTRPSQAWYAQTNSKMQFRVSSSPACVWGGGKRGLDTGTTCSINVMLWGLSAEPDAFKAAWMHADATASIWNVKIDNRLF